VTAKELLDELWDVLPEIGMKAMNVPRALPLGQISFRPRKIEIES
jgi:hypothetical protein